MPEHCVALGLHTPEVALELLPLPDPEVEPELEPENDAVLDPELGPVLEPGLDDDCELKRKLEDDAWLRPLPELRPESTEIIVAS